MFNWSVCFLDSTRNKRVSRAVGCPPRARPPGAGSKRLGSSTTNRARRGDAIPAELFQVLKGDAVKVLHSICQ